MRTKIILAGLIFCFSSCSRDSIKPELGEGCITGNVIELKETAKESIVGKWTWVQTKYSSRIEAGNYTETPISTNKRLVFEFKDDKLKVFENDVLTEVLDYEIKYSGEGTNTIDSHLVLHYRKQSTGEYLERSIILLSSTSASLTLVNSYDDAGGDMYFKRVN